MKKFLFTAVLLCSCTLAFNQTSSLSGVVKDDTGEPLIGATVKLMTNHTFVKGMVADFEGNFVFQSVVPGVYELEVNYTGYQTKRVEKVVVRTGKLQHLDVVMETQDLDCCCCGCCLVHYNFFPPLINQDPGNTGTTFTAAQLIRKD